MISDVIINMVRAVSFLDTGGAIDATVDFDDSIIEDSNSLIDKNVKLVNAGLFVPSLLQSWRLTSALNRKLRKN